MAAEIENAFERVLNEPCWGVQNTFGSFVVLNFGQPRLEVYEPRRTPHTGRLRRLVVASGQDHLWIQQAAWSLVRDGIELAHCETQQRAMDAVLREELAGQELVHVLADGGRCEFHFDLGTVLYTWPHAGDEGPDREGEWPAMWSLYSHPNTVLTFFGNGSTDVGAGDAARPTAPSSTDSGVRTLPE